MKEQLQVYIEREERIDQLVVVEKYLSEHMF